MLKLKKIKRNCLYTVERILRKKLSWHHFKREGMTVTVDGVFRKMLSLHYFEKEDMTVTLSQNTK